MSSSKTNRKLASSANSSRPSSTVEESQISESRKRQSKRDDAIRRKIENDLSKKKRSGTRSNRSKKGAPGTVLALRPSDPVICKTTSTVYEASQLMSAKRENCVLVVSEDEELLGIFTAKDLAFRIVGSGLNANVVTIDQIMTPNPMCANANTPASDALTLMVEKGFRHLPVLDDDNQIVGVLDITKCYAQQMEKLERMHASSKKLYEALDSVHSEIGMSQQPLQVFKYFEDLKNKMNGPTLESVLNGSTVPVYISVKESVYDASVLMRENRTTAVLVKDSNDEVTGIFTSKDVVLRVIAAGLDPKKCSIVRVMTPQPDVSKVTTPIQKALRQMFDGHYLNLPVTGHENEIIGIVDVLTLTYATLNQIQQIETNGSDFTDSNKESNPEGPAWNKFWTSLENEDSESVHSDSVTGSAPDVTPSEFQSFNIDIKPSDSVSHTGSPIKPNRTIPTEKSSTFSFKFKSPSIEGRVHRITLNPNDGVGKLRELIYSKLYLKDFEFMKVKKSQEEEGDEFAISYVDDEGDIISITSDHDLLDCVKINLELSNDKADLYIHNPHVSVPLDIKPNQISRRNKPSNDLIPGIRNEVLIPATLGALATSAIVGFILSRGH